MMPSLTETRGNVEKVTKPGEEALKWWLLAFESMHKEIGNVEREKRGYANREQPGYCGDNSHAV
jgi:hypothetical protein